MSAVSGCCWPMYQIHLNRQKTEWTEPPSYSSDWKQTKSTCQLSSQTLIKKSLFSSSSPLFFYLSFKQMSVWIFFSFSKNNCIYYLDKTKTGQRLQRYSAYISGLQVKSTDTATCRTNYHCLLTISNSPTPVELITITNSPTSWPWSCLQKRFYSFPLTSTFISCLCLLYLQFHCSTANLFFLINIIIFKASFQSAACREEIKKKYFVQEKTSK